MVKKKSTSKKAQSRKKPAWETEPIAWRWVPLAGVLAVGLPFIALSVYNRFRIADLKETTQPVPDSEKNIKELYNEIRAVRDNQGLQKALIDQNKARMEQLQTSFESLPNKDDLEQVAARSEELSKQTTEIQKQIRADAEAISASRRQLTERLDAPWVAIAAPLGTGLLWGLGSFILTWPIFGAMFFGPKPTDPTLRHTRFRNRFILSGLVGGTAAFTAWAASGGPKGLGIGE